MPQYGLGRVPSPTDSRDFPMSAHLPARVSARKYRYWAPGPVLDQGATPHCVGFSWAQWRQTSPIRSLRTAGDTIGHAIYRECKLIDGIPNIDGSYVRVGAKVMQNEGRLATYVWANRFEDLTTWVLEKGPVVVGTNWHEAMFDPDRDGTLHPVGEVVGGHAYLITGYSAVDDRFRIVNSWGSFWGQNGKAWISGNDMWHLIDETGEAVSALEV